MLWCSGHTHFVIQTITPETVRWYQFLIWFPMKYWDFPVKSKSILPLVVTREITIFIFTVSKNRTFYEFWVKSLGKGLKCTILVWNYSEDINVPRWNRWRHLLRWPNAFSARDIRRTITAAFSLRRCLALYCFKCYLASFSRYKTMFYQILCPLNTLNKTKLTRNG